MKKSPWTCLLAGLLAVGISNAESVNFPAGTFENGTATSWAPQTTGAGVANTPVENGNTVGRVAITGTGSGELSNIVPSAFLPNSLYVISVDVKFASLAGASTQIGIAALDGNGTVVKQLTQDQITNALGINLGTVPTLASELTALVGKLGLTATLRDLLALLDGNSTALGAIQQLAHSLIGANSSTLSALRDLLVHVLDGSLDPGTLTSQDIAQLLGVASVSPLVADLQAVLTSVAGNDGVIEALENVIGSLVSAPGDTGVVDNLLASLVGEEGLVANVADILTYALADPGLLSTLNDTLTRSLLGVADPAGGSSFQNVKLLFSTGTAAPAGGIGVRLSSAATLALGQTVTFDNVTVQRFALATMPGISAGTRAPVLRVFGKHVRKNSRNWQVIRGSATAFGAQNGIRRVEYRLKGPGAGARKHRPFRRAMGTKNWKIVVKPISGHIRVLVRAVDLRFRRSPITKVYLVHRDRR